MPKLPFNQVSGDAQDALTEFSTEFDAALAVASPEDQWAIQLGLYHRSNAIQTVFPVPVSAAGYVRREGDDQMRSLYARSMNVKPEEWQDGVQEKARIVEAPDFVGWLGEPARMAMEAARHGNTITAAMLEANANLGFYADAKIGLASTRGLFDDAHPFNIFDPSSSTFDNDQTGTAIDATLLKAVKQRFRERKGPNGKPMGLRVTHCIVPASREEEAKDFFGLDTIIETIQNVAGSENVAAVTRKNRHSGVTLVVADELTNGDQIYFLDARPNAPKAWVYQEGPMEEIVYDKTSDLYKDTGIIGVKRVLVAASAGCLPHAIERVTLS